uniref:Uncharacterized protein n=1 Tax=Trypanosoma vivax (strain Y486) TaxID=1055687 RepID=G0TVZ0_TRYVY|nr:hypothetical protein TVY486_0503070 [Trypanosoma vivax Y486]
MIVHVLFQLLSLSLDPVHNSRIKPTCFPTLYYSLLDAYCMLSFFFLCIHLPPLHPFKPNPLLPSLPFCSYLSCFMLYYPLGRHSLLLGMFPSLISTHPPLPNSFIFFFFFF